MTTVHVVVPDGIDDPAAPSGGNTYDRRVCRGLAEAGWRVQEHPVGGAWPWPDAAAEAAVAEVVTALPDGALVLVDGLVAGTVPRVLVQHAHRLALIVLLHLLLGDSPPGHQVAEARVREGAVLHAARRVVVTSGWTRQRVLHTYGLPAEKVVVAEPGTDAADLVEGTPAGGRLLCVGAVTAHKGHDLLVEALAGMADLAWCLVSVGTLQREPDFVRTLRQRAEASGIADRVCLRGPLTGARLDQAYAGADLLVLASHAETYGMVVPEALARGLPVLATAVGGVPEALGCTPDGRRPGLLVPPDDVPALAAALRRWLSEAALRERLRAAAAERRPRLSGWPVTTDRIADVLTGAVA